MSVIYFLVLVGVLVAIHELGHFIAAKLLDFKVTRFSIGFGRPLLRVRGRETDYQVGLFPLGGYVRILGEDPHEPLSDADRPRAFCNKPLWQRVIVVFAGPAANFLLPVLIYFVAFAGDSSLEAAVVGDVLEGTPAARAGIEPGDRILEIEGESVRYWEDVEAAVRDEIGDELHFRLRRGSRVVERYVAPVAYTRRSRKGDDTVQHGAIGIRKTPFLPQVAIIDPTSPAGRAGLVTGDLIVGIDGVEIRNWSALMRRVEGGARRMSLSVLRGVDVGGLGVKVLEPYNLELVTEAQPRPGGGTRIIHGLEPAQMYVARVDGGTPADFAGLRVGDVITSIDDEPVVHWMVLDQMLQTAPERTFRIGWRRFVGGSVVQMTAQLTQEMRSETDEYGHPHSEVVFGAHTEFERGQAEMVEIDGRLTYAASKAVERAGETISVMATSFLSVLRGKSPGDEFGGPIMMFRVASVSGKKGWEAFFLMIALVSVSVGLINLLPVPVLDGGHLLLFLIEGIRRRPLSAFARDRITYVGLAIVGLITVLALRNDVVRYVM